MVAQVKGGRLRRSFEPWPGYVDVLSTLLMVIIFVLLIFVVAQVFLGNALSGRDEELQRLRRQVQELGETLGLERKTSETLRSSVGDLSGELQASVSSRDALERRLKVAEEERSAMAASLAQAQAELEALREAKSGLQQKLAETSDVAATRDALNLRLTAVIGERDALTTRLADTEARARDLAAALARKGDEAARLAAQRDALSHELDTTRGELAGTEGALADTRKRAEAAETALKETRDTLAETRSRLDETTASLADARSRLDATRQQLAEAQQRLDQMASRLVALQSAVAAGDEALKTEREARAAVEARLADAYKTIEADSGKVQALLGDIAVLQSLRDELEKKVLAARQKGEAEVAAQKALTSEAQRQAELLNAQLLSLRERLETVQQALGIREAEVESQRIEITELGNKLNAALLSKMQELERYRSEFFGRLREVLGDRQDVAVVGDRFVFQSEVLFDSGSAEIGEDGKAQLAAFARTLLDVASRIPSDIDWLLRVDGHTDIRPINSPQFPSNWELSAARAIAVVKFLESQGIEPKRLAATGFGEFRPIAEGTDEESLRRNRRIELKLDQR